LKKFNTTGVCIPDKHYMADTSSKIDKIAEMVEEGNYFTINRPRQYGKTTTLFLLEKWLNRNYIIISISFEGIDETVYSSSKLFVKELILMIIDVLDRTGDYENEIVFLNENIEKLSGMTELSRLITQFVKRLDKKIVLLIDEVDKSLNNQLYLDFLAMLRNKFLLKNMGKDYTFHSVVLSGVHDVKTLKLKLRPEQQKSYNSPWNIAVDFNVDMSFSSKEIESMLKEYSSERNIEMDICKISEMIFYYTSGYPFLVSRMCQIIDDRIMVNKKWQSECIDEAVNMLLKESNTNFDSLVKNLENDKELYAAVYDIIIDGNEKTYNMHNPLIKLGETYGLFRESNGKLKIHNRIYEQLIYNYMSSKIEMVVDMGNYNFKGNLLDQNGLLDFEKVLIKFQQFMKKEYSKKDKEFVERNGRLLFLAFIKPVINGRGYDFKEVQISEERRLDVVITYLNNSYVVELKMWYGQKAHEKGLKQLSRYLDILNLDKGYLIIYDTRKSSKQKQDKVSVNNKQIFAVWV